MHEPRLMTCAQGKNNNSDKLVTRRVLFSPDQHEGKSSRYCQHFEVSVFLVISFCTSLSAAQYIHTDSAMCAERWLPETASVVRLSTFKAHVEDPLACSTTSLPSLRRPAVKETVRRKITYS